MRLELLVCVAMCGCGFRSNAGPTDAAAIDAPEPSDAVASDAVASDAAANDAAADAASDAPTPPVSPCFQRWLAQDIALDAPVELTQLSTSVSERDPWISKDGRSLYFARDPGTRGQNDVYLASRAAPTDAFVTAAEVSNLNTVKQDARAALTEDERTLVLSSDRDGPLGIYMITRASRDVGFGSPDQARLGRVNGPGGSVQNYDPFLTADGSKLYLAADPPAQTQHIWVATLDRARDEYAEPVKLPVVNAPDPAADADPALSLDERVLVFSSTRSGGVDLYYATRANPGLDFGPPVRMPTVNGGAIDGDPMLSADGCELYFASNRNGGDFDLFLARVTP